MNNKRKNGVVNVDTPQMDTMRRTVVEQELSARSWKAYYEKMYYALESEKLEAEFALFQERAKKKLDEQSATMEEFMKKLKDEMDLKNEQDPNGTLGLEEAQDE